MFQHFLALKARLLDVQEVLGMSHNVLAVASGCYKTRVNGRHAYINFEILFITYM
jgi:hypothetical protein